MPPHGPTTPEGKATASRNATRHGLTAAAIVMSNESAAEWQQFRDAALHDLAPEGPLEETLAARIAESLWRLRRAAAGETFTLNRAAHLAARRAEENAIAQLNGEAGFVSLDEERRLRDFIDAPPPPPPMLPSAYDIQNIVRYEAHLNRQLRQSLTQLDLLQTRRLARTAASPETTPAHAPHAGPHAPGNSENYETNSALTPSAEPRPADRSENYETNSALTPSAEPRPADRSENYETNSALTPSADPPHAERSENYETNSAPAPSAEPPAAERSENYETNSPLTPSAEPPNAERSENYESNPALTPCAEPPNAERTENYESNSRSIFHPPPSSVGATPRSAAASPSRAPPLGSRL